MPRETALLILASAAAALCLAAGLHQWLARPTSPTTGRAGCATALVGGLLLALVALVAYVLFALDR
jgi:hypothetical protein